MFELILTWALGIVLIIGLILFFSMFRKCRKPPQVARRKLKVLQRAYFKNKTPQKTPQEVALQIEQLLKSGLGVSQLEQFKSQETTNWEIFLGNLKAISSSERKISSDDLKQLFEQSYLWLEKV